MTVPSSSFMTAIPSGPSPGIDRLFVAWPGCRAGVSHPADSVAVTSPTPSRRPAPHLAAGLAEHLSAHRRASGHPAHAPPLRPAPLGDHLAAELPLGVGEHRRNRNQS